MKIVQINATCGRGSTGKIAVDISKLLDKENIENYIFYVGSKSDHKNSICYAGNNYLKFQALKTRVYGNYGFNSKRATKKLVNQLKAIDPDIIHLHNIHGHNVNLPILFNYLKDLNKKVVWTFHDCWAFTGGCTHFDYISCYKWKERCLGCTQNNMSWFFDRTDYMYNEKKRLFNDLKNLIIITPSEWLAKLVKESFLANHSINVINNGIDLNVFKPTESNFREKYGLENKKIILGVAMGLGQRKGFNYFIELAGRIDNNSCIVLVGVSKKQIVSLPDNVIGIEKTANQNELAGVYTAADVFVNCTLEDNFPTVNLEALACGTPVITFNTGGSVECIDEDVGIIVKQGDVEGIIDAINQIENIKDCGEKCIAKARRCYDKNKCFQEYIKLYNKLRDV